mgnify:CR=1 FL=1
MKSKSLVRWKSLNLKSLNHRIMLYNFGIIAYRCAIGVASLFNEKAALWVKGRKGIWKRMEAVDRGKGRLVWFHAASLGEFEQGRPVIERLKD